jgi:hypothetical protein
MGFILRIMFSGLIAFVPSQDGKELTVLLLNAGHNFQISDGTQLAHHMPMLLARAGSCAGQCTTRDPNVAQHLFSDLSADEALDALAAATSGGGAWLLSDSELSIRRGCSRDPMPSSLGVAQNLRGSANGQVLSIPSTTQEREDFSWVTDLKQLCPSGCVLNPALLSSQPPSGLIAARLRLRNGRVFTYSIVRNAGKVTPMHFQTLSGTTALPYSQAVASWVAADIQVSGDTIELVEDKFGSTPSRSMSLAPGQNGIVEVAILNLPPVIPPSSPATTPPDPGRHFEIYYDLLQTPPASDNRPVPFPGPASSNTVFPDVDWDAVRPPLNSDLLARLRLNIDKGIYDRVLCPMVQY